VVWIACRLRTPRAPPSSLLPYTTLFRSAGRRRSRILRGHRGNRREVFALQDAFANVGELLPDRLIVLELVGLQQDVPRMHLRLRSEEHTSELQSRENLVCRLLLEKKKSC